MTVERLTRASGMDRAGHEYRYRLAADFLQPGDAVIDAACGTGYGSELLGVVDCRYLGVDRSLDHLEVDETPFRRFSAADLCTWQPEEPFDVFVTFETIEHLASYDHFIQLARQARRLIVASVPVAPTTHLNHYHLHDFEPGDLAKMLGGDGWDVVVTVQQPAESSEIVVLRRSP